MLISRLRPRLIHESYRHQVRRQCPELELEPRQSPAQLEQERPRQPEFEQRGGVRGEDLCVIERFDPSAKHAADFRQFALRLENFGFIDNSELQKKPEFQG